MADRDIKCAEWMKAELEKLGQLPGAVFLPAWSEVIFIMREIDGISYHRMVNAFRANLGKLIRPDTFDIHEFHNNFAQLEGSAMSAATQPEPVEQNTAQDYGPGEEYYKILQGFGISLNQKQAPEKPLQKQPTKRTNSMKYRQVHRRGECTACRKTFDMLIEFDYLPRQHFCLEHAMTIYSQQETAQ